MTQYNSEHFGENKTVFLKFLDKDLNWQKAESSPESFDRVTFIGRDEYYGDVFKAWDERYGIAGGFTLFIWVAGDEFK